MELKKNIDIEQEQFLILVDPGDDEAFDRLLDCFRLLGLSFRQRITSLKEFKLYSVSRISGMMTINRSLVDYMDDLDYWICKGLYNTIINDDNYKIFDNADEFVNEFCVKELNDVDDIDFLS